MGNLNSKWERLLDELQPEGIVSWEHHNELLEGIQELEAAYASSQRELLSHRVAAEVADNAFGARVAELETRCAQLKESHDHLLTYTVGPLQVENAEQRVTIGKLEDRIRDLELYGEVTDGTMFANPPPPKEKP